MPCKSRNNLRHIVKVSARRGNPEEVAAWLKKLSRAGTGSWENPGDGNYEFNIAI